jgi:hypothetical protein
MGQDEFICQIFQGQYLDRWVQPYLMVTLSKNVSIGSTPDSHGR